MSQSEIDAQQAAMDEQQMLGRGHPLAGISRETVEYIFEEDKVSSLSGPMARFYSGFNNKIEALANFDEIDEIIQLDRLSFIRASINWYPRRRTTILNMIDEMNAEAVSHAQITVGRKALGRKLLSTQRIERTGTEGRKGLLDRVVRR